MLLKTLTKGVTTLNSIQRSSQVLKCNKITDNWVGNQIWRKSMMETISRKLKIKNLFRCSRIVILTKTKAMKNSMRKILRPILAMRIRFSKNSRRFTCSSLQNLNRRYKIKRRMMTINTVRQMIRTHNNFKISNKIVFSLKITSSSENLKKVMMNIQISNTPNMKMNNMTS